MMKCRSALKSVKELHFVMFYWSDKTIKSCKLWPDVLKQVGKIFLSGGRRKIDSTVTKWNKVYTYHN